MDKHNMRQAGHDVSRRNMLKTIGIGSVAALGAVGLSQTNVAYAQAAGDSVETMLNVAITAEALATTLVYGVITQSTFFSQLPAIHQDALRATLTTEQTHFDLLAAQGGRPLLTQFFIPNGLLESVPLLVTVGDFLETTCIGAYLAATRRFAELAMPLMSEVASQLGGSEAEHRALIRALGRDVAGIPLIPNNIPIERPTLFQVSQAQGVLAPFLRGGTAFEREFVGPVALPPRQQVLAAGLELEPVPLASAAF